ncbi:hypothetical protein D3C80_1940790 [compost metagenome]
MRVWLIQTKISPQMPISSMIAITTETSVKPPAVGMVPARKIPTRPLIKKVKV